MAMDIGMGLLVFGPAILGLTSLGLAIFLFARARGTESGDEPSTWRFALGSVLLVVALGIGACYGVFFLG